MPAAASTPRWLLIGALARTLAEMFGLNRHNSRIPAWLPPSMQPLARLSEPARLRIVAQLLIDRRSGKRGNLSSPRDGVDQEPKNRLLLAGYCTRLSNL